MHAKSALILGHTSSGMGEKSLALNLHRVLQRGGGRVAPIVDILELLGEAYEPLARLNYDLADVDLSLVEDLKCMPKLPSSDLLLILSWSFSVAALFATGIHRTRPTVVNLFVHHPEERILTQLYQPADLLITESLLANERAYAYGIDPGKVLYLPHCFPKECASIHSSRHYVNSLAQELGKEVGSQTRVIGCVSRFEYGKNCEFAVEAVRRLVEKGEDVVLVLKGDFPEESPYPEYRTRFTEMLETYQNASWLLWDRKWTPFPEVLEEYASFDLLLHPSGAEGGSHVVVECLGLLKPVILLDCSTNPYLFRGVATFVKTEGELNPAMLPFYYPDIEDLVEKLCLNILPPDKAAVEARFHEEVLESRLPLIFERDREKIEGLYENDRKLYDL